MAQKRKGAGKYTPPDIQAQAEEGSVDRPKASGDDYGVMSARAGSWTDLADPDRYTPTPSLSMSTISVLLGHNGSSLAVLPCASCWPKCPEACIAHCC